MAGVRRSNRPRKQRSVAASSLLELDDILDEAPPAAPLRKKHSAHRGRKQDTLTADEKVSLQCMSEKLPALLNMKAGGDSHPKQVVLVSGEHGWTIAGVKAVQPESVRVRVKNACARCRKLKTRCDSKRPCDRCTRSGRALTCVDAVHKTGSRTPSHKKARPKQRSNRRWHSDDEGSEDTESQEHDDNGSKSSDSWEGAVHSRAAAATPPQALSGRAGNKGAARGRAPGGARLPARPAINLWTSAEAKQPPPMEPDMTPQQRKDKAIQAVVHAMDMHMNAWKRTLQEGGNQQELLEWTSHLKHQLLQSGSEKQVLSKLNKTASPYLFSSLLCAHCQGDPDQQTLSVMPLPAVLVDFQEWPCRVWGNAQMASMLGMTAEELATNLASPVGAASLHHTNAVSEVTHNFLTNVAGGHCTYRQHGLWMHKDGEHIPTVETVWVKFNPNSCVPLRLCVLVGWQDNAPAPVPSLSLVPLLSPRPSIKVRTPKGPSDSPHLATPPPSGRTRRNAKRKQISPVHEHHEEQVQQAPPSSSPRMRLNFQNPPVQLHRSSAGGAISPAHTAGGVGGGTPMASCRVLSSFDQWNAHKAVAPARTRTTNDQFPHIQHPPPPTLSLAIVDKSAKARMMDFVSPLARTDAFMPIPSGDAPSKAVEHMMRPSHDTLVSGYGEIPTLSQFDALDD